MKIPEEAPILDGSKFKGTVFNKDALALSVSFNEKYLHWDDLRYRDLNGYDRIEIWTLMKMSRMMQSKQVVFPCTTISYCLTDQIQESLHKIDFHLLKGSFLSDPDDKKNILYLISSTMEESIASSQIEGASTATVVAKKLLRDGTAPKDLSEQMICNNYKAMQFIRSKKDELLTPELIREIHGIISHDTFEDSRYEGCFRDDDSIAVRDAYNGKTYYEPVAQGMIESSIEELCRYANDDSVFTHPIVKGVIIHFMLAYIHPFIDGNGRVSRSLFYWYSLKKGYSAIEFLAISKAIKQHKGRYDMAYLLSETDGNDVTYFLRYNVDVILEAIDIFEKYLKRKADERKIIFKDVYDKGFTHRQMDILSDMVRSNEAVEVRDVASKYNISDASARRDLLKIVDEGLAVRVKEGHRILYSSLVKRE